MYRYIFGIIALLTGLALSCGKYLPFSRAEVIRSLPVHQKVIALTFDDGPHPVYTRQLLDILQKYHVKATFFMVGSAMNQYPETVRAIVAKGHAVGNHTYSHPRNLPACPDRRISREIAACQTVIQKRAGQKTVLFRPPRGLYDRRVVKAAAQRGLVTVLWTVCGNNRRAGTPQLIARRVIARIRPGGIILLHDGNFDCRWKDVEATQLILESLLKKGYRFVTLPRLLNLSKG